MIKRVFKKPDNAGVVPTKPTIVGTRPASSVASMAFLNTL
jgi:hypothetical protein